MNTPVTDATPDMSQGEAAYRALLGAIAQGRYRPGDRLREIEIAQSLALSRTPVREALRRLEADGIVEHRPRLGAVLRSLSHTEVVELYEMRLVLERTAAEMAAKHAAPAEVDDLADINRSLLEAVSPAQAIAFNQKFHRSIYLAARNRFLRDSARALTNALMLIGPTTLADADRLEVVHRQHQDIIKAIQSRDPSAAGDAAAEHLETSLRYRLKVMRA